MEGCNNQLNNNMQKKNPLIALGISLGVIVLVILVLLVMRNFKVGTGSSSASNVGTIVLKKDGTSFSVDASGNAIWTTNGVTTSALWSASKTGSFFAYYNANWASGANIENGTATVNAGSDELASAVISEGNGSGGGGGGGSGGGGDLSQYFGSPTPTPSGGSGGSGGGSGGGGGNNGGPSWCLHWRLSYCADPPPDTSTPIPTATPIPGQATPLPPDCNDPGNQQTGRTVIGNELCLPNPTPTATP